MGGHLVVYTWLGKRTLEGLAPWYETNTSYLSPRV